MHMNTAHTMSLSLDHPSVCLPPGCGALNISNKTCLTMRSGPIRSVYPIHCSFLTRIHTSRSNVLPSVTYVLLWLFYLSVITLTMLEFAPFSQSLTLLHSQPPSFGTICEYTSHTRLIQPHEDIYMQLLVRPYIPHLDKSLPRSCCSDLYISHLFVVILERWSQIFCPPGVLCLLFAPSYRWRELLLLFDCVLP